MNLFFCTRCGSQADWKRGLREEVTAKDGKIVKQSYHCLRCHHHDIDEYKEKDIKKSPFNELITKGDINGR